MKKQKFHFLSLKICNKLKFFFLTVSVFFSISAFAQVDTNTYNSRITNWLQQSEFNKLLKFDTLNKRNQTEYYLKFKSSLNHDNKQNFILNLIKIDSIIYEQKKLHWDNYLYDELSKELSISRKSLYIIIINDTIRDNTYFENLPNEKIISSWIDSSKLRSLIVYDAMKIDTNLKYEISFKPNPVYYQNNFSSFYYKWLEIDSSLYKNSQESIESYVFKKVSFLANISHDSLVIRFHLDSSSIGNFNKKCYIGYNGNFAISPNDMVLTLSGNENNTVPDTLRLLIKDLKRKNLIKVGKIKNDIEIKELNDKILKILFDYYRSKAMIRSLFGYEIYRDSAKVELINHSNKYGIEVSNVKNEVDNRDYYESLRIDIKYIKQGEYIYIIYLLTAKGYPGIFKPVEEDAFPLESEKSKDYLDKLLTKINEKL